MQQKQTKQVEISISTIEATGRQFFNKIGKLFNEAKKYKVIVQVSRVSK